MVDDNDEIIEMNIRGIRQGLSLRGLMEIFEMLCDDCKRLLMNFSVAAAESINDNMLDKKGSG